MSSRCGFTLIELSIILVIIGLIMGAILFGQDLIRAAELRHVHKQYESFISAVNTFRSKYNCLPGDCDHATDFWPATPEGCYYPVDTGDGNPDPSGYPQEMTACNGNGDGRMDIDSNITVEGYGAWQHLADAGLIGGSFSGSSLDIVGGQWVANYNCPPARTDSNCWNWYDGDYLTSMEAFSGLTDNAGHLGAVLLVLPREGLLGKAMFTPAEALAYDTKYDDGRPDSGQVLAQGDFLSPQCTTASPGPYSYDQSKAGRNCDLLFRTGF
jgi:type II secretory pathway pseudopilin PulG